MNLVNDASSSDRKSFKNTSALHPSASREVRYAFGISPLGTILVGLSIDGVCAILIGDDYHVLLDDLGARFPSARLINDAELCQDALTKVVEFLHTPGIGLNLPLDMGGTPFQQRVWEALREIPVGQTVTYTEIARAIGAPKSARAVARACATNRLALAIPCHRVVRGDGGIAGYRWGTQRKQTLLTLEANA